MPNRLAKESSPYLTQHSQNPIDWYPWGPEAFDRAVEEDKPIFLSVGYSSCHWCHVMEHESFEDADVAAILNPHFICIKVDREERPDVDEAYMAAVQLMTQRGGWPMSLFLTPDRKPFYAGTYIPKEDAPGRLGLKSLGLRISEQWAENRNEFDEVANNVATRMTAMLARVSPENSEPIDENLVDRAVMQILGDYDPENGGFGNAPKFPPHSAIELLLAYAGLVDEKPTEEVAKIAGAAVEAAFYTLEAMVAGGIHDHLAGGFHRYSTDEKWILPHFEKMLYDNALLLGNLAQGSAIFAEAEPALSDRLADAAGNIVKWVVREMRGEDGLFFSAIDADSEGEEGKFYVWTKSEIDQILGPTSSEFCEAFSIREEGNFLDEATQVRTGANVLYRSLQSEKSFEEERELLRRAREARVRPAVDVKALIAWNGLLIGAMAGAGLVQAAAVTAEAVLEYERRHGTLPHQVVRGVTKGQAFLDGYAYFADALFQISEVVEAFEQAGEPLSVPRSANAYRLEGERLTQEMIARFYDEEEGGFFFSGEGHEELFGRTKPIFDQPIPSPNSRAIRCLAAFGDERRYRQSVTAFLGWIQAVPQSTESLLFASLPLLIMPVEETPEPIGPVNAAPIPSTPPQVKANLNRTEITVGGDGWGDAVAFVLIPEGYHVNSPEPPARWLVPTLLSIKPLRFQVTYPPYENDRYEGEIQIPFRVHLPSGQSGAEFEVRLNFQLCSETECQLAQEIALGAVAVLGSDRK